MFIIKKNYYLYIENIKDLNVDILKNNRKINIILRNVKKNKISELLKFRQKCKSKRIKLYIANDLRLAKICDADGLYISAYNKKKYFVNISKIGSAHNLKEIKEKIFQSCNVIIFSRLFKTQYENKKTCLGILKFNLLCRNISKKLVPLGGINNQNLLKLNIIKSESLACLSSLKKKPTISSRLF